MKCNRGCSIMVLEEQPGGSGISWFKLHRLWSYYSGEMVDFSMIVRKIWSLYKSPENFIGVNVETSYQIWGLDSDQSEHSSRGWVLDNKKPLEGVFCVRTAFDICAWAEATWARLLHERDVRFRLCNNIIIIVHHGTVSQQQTIWVIEETAERINFRALCTRLCCSFVQCTNEHVLPRFWKAVCYTMA